MAIMIDHFLKQQKASLQVDIFATDIDQDAIRRAMKGVYSSECLANIRYGLFRQYFTSQNGGYVIAPGIRAMVQFSTYDLRDRDRSVPSDSVFGDFDIVLCRNVLIYLNREVQEQVFLKLHHALAPGGYLVLGEAERPVDNAGCRLDVVSHACHVYQRRLNLR
jgi:chemotaxis methyl-accepting protein methylase